MGNSITLGIRSTNVPFRFCKSLIQESTNKDKKLEKLHAELNSLTEQLHRMENQMVHTSVMDRWNLGQFLHDSLAQKLTYAKIAATLLKEKLVHQGIDAAADLDEIIRVIDEGVREIRDLSHDIIPVDVQEDGILPALRSLEQQVSNRHGVSCRLQTDDVVRQIKDREITTNLYHIAQEAVKNAIIHGKATTITIALIRQNGQLCLRIEDDGAGFDPAGDRKGMGIVIMKHRAKEIGGTFALRGGEDNGSTCVSCTLPLKALGLD